MSRIYNIGAEKWFDAVLQGLFIGEEIALLIQSLDGSR
jgi:hypothetical protein